MMSVILERRDEEEQRRLKIEEAKLQTLVGAVHAAAGNKRGAAMAGKIRLTRKDKDDVPSFESVRRLFPGEPLMMEKSDG